MNRVSHAFRAMWAAVAADRWQAFLASLPLLLCVPWNLINNTHNYEYLLHVAHVQGLRYGTEILATYGPLGFLAIPFYHPETFRLVLTFQLILYALVIGRLIAVARLLADPRYGTWICLICLPTVLTNIEEWAPVIFIPYVLVLIYCLENGLKPQGLSWWAAAVYAALFAVFSLVKMTFAPLILGVLILWAGVEARRGAFPRTASLYLGMLVVFWLASGQSIHDVPAFVAGSSEVVAGYKEAMERWDMPALLCIIPLLVAYAFLWLGGTVATWRIARGGVFVTSVTLALVSYAVLLNGFVRGDPEHVVPCILTTLSLWGLVDRLIAATRPDRGSLLVSSSRSAFILSLLALSVIWRMDNAQANFGRIVDRPLGLARLVVGGDRHLRAAEIARQNVYGPPAFPELKGVSVDVPNGDSGFATHSGGLLRIRPTVTAYGGYTPALTRANADYLEGTGGPEAIVFLPTFALDRKFPTLDDPRSLLSLLTHYRHASFGGGYVLFRRRPDPRGIRLVPLATRTIRFDEVLSVPQAASRPIWAEIEITPNRLGRLIASAFKPLPVTMTLALENGTEKSSRINPGSVRDGFLMSPFLANDSTLHSLDADDANGWRPHAVKSIRVEGKVGWNGTQTRLESKAFYNDEIEVRLFGVVFEPPPTGDAAAKTGEGTRIGEETPGKRIPSELTGM